MIHPSIGENFLAKAEVRNSDDDDDDDDDDYDDDDDDDNNHLSIEIQRTWNVKTKVTPVIIGATGTIANSFRKYLSSVPGKHDIKELQKTAVLGTAHTLREVLVQKHKRV
jgi:hypothetical protein